MAVPVAVTVVVTILCLGLLLTSALLVYKLRPGARRRRREARSLPGSRNNDNEKVPPVRKLCVDRGRVVSAPPSTTTRKETQRSRLSSYLSSLGSTRRTSIASLPTHVLPGDLDEKSHRYPVPPAPARNIDDQTPRSRPRSVRSTHSLRSKEKLYAIHEYLCKNGENGETQGLPLDPLVLSSWREYNGHRPANDDLASPLAAANKSAPVIPPRTHDMKTKLPTSTPTIPPEPTTIPDEKIPTPPTPPPPPVLVSDPSTPVSESVIEPQQLPASHWPSGKPLGKRPSPPGKLPRTGIDAKVIKAASICGAPRSAYSPRATPRQSLYSVVDEAIAEEEVPPVPELPANPPSLKPLDLDAAPLKTGFELSSLNSSARVSAIKLDSTRPGTPEAEERRRSYDSPREPLGSPRRPSSRDSLDPPRVGSGAGVPSTIPELPDSSSPPPSTATSDEMPKAAATITDLSIDFAAPITEYMQTSPARPKKVRRIGRIQKEPKPESPIPETIPEHPPPEPEPEQVDSEPSPASNLIASNTDVQGTDIDRLGRTVFPLLPVSRFSAAYRSSGGRGLPPPPSRHRSRSRSDSTSTRSRSRSRPRNPATHRVRKRPPPLALRPAAASRAPVIVRSATSPGQTSLAAAVDKATSSSDSPEDQVPDELPTQRDPPSGPRKKNDRFSTVTVTSSNYSPPPSLARIRRVPVYAAVQSPQTSYLGRPTMDDVSPKVIHRPARKPLPKSTKKRNVTDSVLQGPAASSAETVWPPLRRASGPKIDSARVLPSPYASSPKERSRRTSEQHVKIWTPGTAKPAKYSPPVSKRHSPPSKPTRSSPPPETALSTPPAPLTARKSRYSHLTDKALPSLPPATNTQSKNDDAVSNKSGEHPGPEPSTPKSPNSEEQPSSGSTAANPARRSAMAAALSAAAAVGPASVTGTVPGQSSTETPRQQKPSYGAALAPHRGPSLHRKSPSAGSALEAKGSAAAQLKTPPRPTTLPAAPRARPVSASAESSTGVSPMTSPERGRVGALRGNGDEEWEKLDLGARPGGWVRRDEDAESVGRSVSEVSPLSVEFSVAVQRSMSRR